MADRQVDILVIGGGLTGACLLLALAGKGYSCLLVEAKPFSDRVKADFDARSLALAPAAVRILERLELWPLLHKEAAAIDRIQVSDQYHFGAARLQGQQDKPLGYVVEMQRINSAIAERLDKSQLLAPAQLIALDKLTGLATLSTEQGELKIQAQLIVAADGAESTARRLAALPVKIKDYGQQAIVANIGLARGHRAQAFERFTSSGPLALLPMTEQRASLVWALQPEEAQRLMACSEKEFLKALQLAFGYRAGRLVKAGQRSLFPLRQYLMPQQVAWPLVFVGNAAHTLHPVAGQGFNLGLRDVAALAQCIVQQGLNQTMLQHYQRMRQYDQRAIIGITDSLVGVFGSRLPGMAFLRNLGLIAVDNLPFLKRTLAHYARGFAGFTPDLVCGLALDAEEFK